MQSPGRLAVGRGLTEFRFADWTYLARRGFPIDRGFRRQPRDLNTIYIYMMLEIL